MNVNVNVFGRELEKSEFERRKTEKKKKNFCERR